MKERIIKVLIGVGVLVALAVPGYSSPVTSFESDGTGAGGAGSITLITNGSNGDVSNITNVTFSTIVLTPGGPGTFETTLSETSAGSGTLTLVTDQTLNTGVFAAAPIANGQTLFTIHLLNAATSLSTVLGQVVDVQFSSGEASSITINANLVTDLGYSAGDVAALLAGGALTSGSNAVGSTSPGTVNNLTSNAIIIGLTLAPEPMSFVLFGSGLLGIWLLARRRSSQQIQ